MRLSLKSVSAIATLAALLTAISGAAGAAVSDNRIRNIAQEIGTGLDAAPLSAVPSAGLYDLMTIKIVSLPDSSGISSGTAGQIAALTFRLTAELQRRYGSKYRFVSQDAQQALIEDIGKQASEDARGRAIEDIEARGKPDILLRPVVFDLPDGLQIFYQAVSVGTAAILANTTPIPLTDTQRAPAARVVTIQAEEPAAALPPPGTDGVYRPVTLEAEKLLRDLGYDPGPVDGYIDQDFRDALSAYQADSALPVNGRMTWETVENMRLDQR